MKPARYILTIEAGEHPTPAALRLRQMLKLALRAFAFRCLDVREATAEKPDCATKDEHNANR